DELSDRFARGVEARIPQSSRVPARLWRVIARGLTIDADKRYPSMSELLGELGRAAGRGRRILRTLAAAAGVTLLVVTALWAASWAEPDPCGEAGRTVDEIWNPAVADTVRTAIMGTGSSYAEDTWIRIKERLDRYTDDLRAERGEICEATHVRRDQPMQLSVLRGICLDRRERFMRAAVTRFAQIDVATLERSMRILADLPSIEGCRDSAAFMLGALPPDDPALAEQVDEIRNRLAEAWVTRLAGDQRKAQQIAEEMLPAARESQYMPVVAETLHSVGVMWLHSGTSQDLTRAKEAMLEAIDLAESHHHDELAADIWISLIALAERTSENQELGHHWARRALAAAVRINDRSRQSMALSRHGTLHFVQHNYEKAAEKQREGLDRAEGSNIDKRLLADQWQGLANTLEALGRFDEAREGYKRGVALMRDELG
ncbi:MAG: hypothetical protein AAGC55_29945, partial [Myxococcota bacterium]